ncbi:MAG: HAD family phosphatase [Phycisphaeraceae bacterium]|nr:MAG: HAD family phosphatase [Phycisphaeraceae bacterium]
MTTDTHPENPGTPPHPARRYDAVICDIDGCLSPEHSGPMDAPSLAKIAAHNHIAQHRHDRPVVTLCSGRPLPFAEAMCRLIGNRTLPIICENGVWMYDPITNEYLMDPAITERHLEMVAEASRWVRTDLGPKGATIQPGKAASISLYHTDTDTLRLLVPDLERTFAREAWTFRVSMTWLYINCDLAHVSKATGLARLKQRTGLTRDRLAGIGDTTSDLAIREHVAWFACPANAQDQIKRHADFIAPHPEAEGAVDILSMLSP